MSLGKTPDGLTKLRLKGVITCSFGRSEASNLRLYRDSAKYPGDLRKGEAFLFISKGGNQVLFVFRPVELEVSSRHRKGDGSKTREVIDSRRLRLDGGTWHPYMLQNYANEVGIHLVGFRRFEEVHKSLMAKKRTK
jgi:hypothetical protein